MRHAKPMRVHALPGFSRANDLLENGEIFLKRLPPLRGERVAGLWAIEDFLGDRHEPGVMQRAQVRDEIAVAHVQFGLEILKSPARAGGEQRHNAEAAFLM